MTWNAQPKPQAAKGPGAWAGALTLALGVSVLSAACSAAGPPGSRFAPELRALLAMNANPLSEDAMARQKGAGLRSPPVITDGPSAATKVLLWDEMRIAPLLNPPNDGLVTGGTGGR